MSQWNHEQSYNNFCQNGDNFYHYRHPPFNERRMNDPRGLNTFFNCPPANRPPPPIVRPHPFMCPSPAGPAEAPLSQLPSFLRHVPPPYPPPPNTYGTLPFGGIPGPFSRPPPQIGIHSVVQDFRHVRRFAPNRPPNYLPPSNCPPSLPPVCPPPLPPVPNSPHPAASFGVVDCRAVAPRPVNIFCQRQPGTTNSLPFGDQRMKRHLNSGYNNGKVPYMSWLLYFYV